MSFFNKPEQRSVDMNWADSLIDNNTIPSYSHGNYSDIRALKNSDVLTAVSIIAGDVAKLPIIEINDADDSIVDDEQISYLVNKKSNENVSAYQWKFSMVVNAILSGNSYSRIIRDTRNKGPHAKQPLGFEFYAPSQVTIVQDIKTGKYTYRFSGNSNEDYKDCKPEDVIHWKFFSSDTIYGRSPLLSLGDEITMQKNGIDTLSKTFKSGLKSGILSMNGKLNKESRRKARQEFEYTQNNSNGPIIVDDTMKYTPLEVDTNVLNLISSNNWSTSQIAKALRIPGFKLGVNSPNQSVNQLQSGYLKYDLPFYLKPIENEFQMKLLDDTNRHKYHFEFDVRKETGTAAGDLATLINNGVITPNEARAEIGKKAVDDEDMNKYQSTLNTVDMHDKLEYQFKTKGGENNGQGNENGTSQNSTT